MHGGAVSGSFDIAGQGEVLKFATPIRFYREVYEGEVTSRDNKRH